MTVALDHNPFAFILPILFGIDLYLTYRYMKNYRRNFPEQTNWANQEMNPIARWAWKTWGLEKGSLIAMLIASPIAIMFTVFAYYSMFFFGLLVGTYILIIRMHIYANRHTKKEMMRRKKVDEILKKKKYFVSENDVKLGKSYTALELYQMIKKDVDDYEAKQRLMKK